LGYSRNGKDTAAEIIQRCYGLTFQSSSEAAAEIFLYKKLKAKYGYKNFEDCYSDRHDHRQEWKEEICLYNKHDKARLAKQITFKNDIYVGMRDTEEIKECRRIKLFDLVIGIYNPRVPREPKESCPIDVFEESDIIIPNAGTIEELEEKIIVFMRAISTSLLNRSF